MRRSHMRVSALCSAVSPYRLVPPVATSSSYSQIAVISVKKEPSDSRKAGSSPQGLTLRR
jgi:hypothetical protein